MAGAEVQANAIWTALHGAPLHQLPPLAALFVVALLAIVAPLVGMRFPALAAGLAVPIAGAPVPGGRAARVRRRPADRRRGPALGAGGRRRGHDRLEPAGREPRPPRRHARQRAARGARARAHQGAVGDPDRGRAAPRRGDGLARRRDRPAHRAHRLLLRAPRPGGRHEARRGGAAAPRQRPPRRGQGRHPRRDPLQARPAERRGVGDDEGPHHDRGEHPGRVRLRARPALRDDRAHAPRALGRQRLPARPAR